MRAAALFLLLTACTQSRQLRTASAELRELNQGSARPRRGPGLPAVEHRRLHPVPTRKRCASIATACSSCSTAARARSPRRRCTSSRSFRRASRACEALDGLLIGGGFVALGAGVGLVVAANCSAASSCKGEALAPGARRSGGGAHRRAFAGADRLRRGRTGALRGERRGCAGRGRH